MTTSVDRTLTALVGLHPELGNPDALVPLDEGFGARLFTAPEGVILRIPRTIDTGRKLPVMSTVGTLADRLPAPVPVPLWIEPPGGSLPFGAMAYSRLDGRALGADVTAIDLAGDIARFLTALHGIAPGEAGLDLAIVPDRNAVDAGRREVMAIALPWLRQRLPAPVFGRLDAWWNQYQAFRASEPFTPTIVHGDFWYGNLLVDDAAPHLTGVLDWEQVAMDDPAQDYATLLHSGPQVADRVLEIACEISGQDRDALLRRRAWHWCYREFTGLAASIETGDIAEATESLWKLRQGGLRDLFNEE